MSEINVIGWATTIIYSFATRIMKLYVERYLKCNYRMLDYIEKSSVKMPPCFKGVFFLVSTTICGDRFS